MMDEKEKKKGNWKWIKKSKWIEKEKMEKKMNEKSWREVIGGEGN